MVLSFYAIDVILFLYLFNLRILYTGCEELLAYFERVYVLGELVAQPGAGINVNINVRRAPQFPSETWNVHDLTLAGEDRTNNQTEGWNNSWYVIRYHHDICISHGGLLRQQTSKAQNRKYRQKSC